MTKTVDLGLMGNQHKCKYWLHRISYEWDVSYALLAKGYLTLGWSDYCTSGIESKVHGERDIEVFESIMKELGETSRSRWNLQVPLLPQRRLCRRSAVGRRIFHLQADGQRDAD